MGYTDKIIEVAGKIENLMTELDEKKRKGAGAEARKLAQVLKNEAQKIRLDALAKVKLIDSDKKPKPAA